MVNILSGCYNIHMDKQPINHHLESLETRSKNNAEFIVRLKARLSEVMDRETDFAMPKEDFEKYFGVDNFSNSPTLKKINIGDCYAIAAIHSMSLSPFFEIMCRSAMRQIEDGSWEVSLPLLGVKKSKIIITQEELLPEKNKNFLKKREGRVLPDHRYRLHSMQANEGYQVLELAYIKFAHEKVDRQAAEGGHELDVLSFFGGDCFGSLDFEVSYFDSKGRTTYTRTLSDLPSSQRLSLDFALENFNPDVDIATAATKSIDLNTFMGKIVKKTVGAHMFKLKGLSKYFFTSHAYSISRVDTRLGLITVLDTWDTSKPIVMTFDQFKKVFSSISIAEINCTKMSEYIDGLKIK